MIAEECKKLREQLNEVSTADDREKIVLQLEERYTELLELKESVVATTDSLKAMSKRTEIVAHLDSTNVHERVRKIRETLREDPQKISQGVHLTNMKKALAKFAAEAGTAIEAAWEQYKPRARPTVDANQIAQAEQQESFKLKAAQLRARAKYADQISKKAPATEEAFADLEATWNEIRQMIAELPAVTNNEKVQQFLKSANSKEGASLELLTDEVWSWLQENRVAVKYRIFSI